MFHVRVPPCAKAHGQVGVFGHHIEQGNAHLQGDVDFGVGIHKVFEAWHQHRARKSGRDRQSQFAPPGGVAGAGKALQRHQAFSHMGEVFVAFGGEREIGPAKQLGADDLFELLDAVTHGTGRHAQLFGGLGHAAQSGQGLKGQKTLNRRDA